MPAARKPGDPIPEDVKAKVIADLKAAKLSQKAIAERHGVSRGSVANWGRAAGVLGNEPAPVRSASTRATPARGAASPTRRARRAAPNGRAPRPRAAQPAAPSPTRGATTAQLTERFNQVLADARANLARIQEEIGQLQEEERLAQQLLEGMTRDAARATTA